jgi:CBS domain containing-hemolysin-like protein
MEGSPLTSHPFPVGWALGAAFLLILLNGFFVAAEFALVKVRRSRVDALVDEGKRSARVARHMLDQLHRYLSACQLGITMASLGLGWLGEPAVAALLVSGAHALGWAISAQDPWLHGTAFTLAFVAITTLHMTVGEQAPKIWAIQRAEQTTLQISLPLRAFSFLFNPLVLMVNGISNAMLRGVGIRPEALQETLPHTAEELQVLLATSARGGHISARQLEIGENVLGMMELEVRHILVPRVDVAYLSLEWPVEENLRVIRKTGHSRFPLCRNGLDTVLGFVHAKDVLSALLDKSDPELRAVARRPVFVPDTQPIPRLILQLQQSRKHCAVVVDEHGTAIGLVFLEDALEEIVGPIQDEFDEEPPEVDEVAPGVVEVQGSMALPDAQEHFQLELEDAHADTIGGHIVELLGRLPRRRDQLELGPYRVTVVEVTRRRVGRLRFEPIAPGTEEPEPSNRGD